MGQLDGEPVELSRSSANALDDRETLLQTGAKTTFPSLAGDLSLGPKMGIQHHRLADENAEDAALAKASEVGQKLEKKASRWTSQANTHEKKAKELESKAGMVSKKKKTSKRPKIVK